MSLEISTSAQKDKDNIIFQTLVQAYPKHAAVHSRCLSKMQRNGTLALGRVVHVSISAWQTRPLNDHMYGLQEGHLQHYVMLQGGMLHWPQLSYEIIHSAQSGTPFNTLCCAASYSVQACLSNIQDMHNPESVLLSAG